MVGYPTQFPSVSMVNWTTGEGTARYWILKLLIDNFQGKNPFNLLQTSNSDVSDIYAQGFITSDGIKKLLVINKRFSSFSVSIPNFDIVQYVDETTGFGPYVTEYLPTAPSYLVNPFGVYIFKNVNVI